MRVRLALFAYLVSRWAWRNRWDLMGRAAFFVATLCGAAALLLLLMHLAPGDAIDMLPNGEELRPILEKEWLLDKPFYMQLLHYLGNVATGDLGTSLTYRPGTPVMDVIFWPAMRSAGWTVSALVLTLCWGTGLAWFTAGRASVSRGLVQLVSIAPVFLVAHLVVNGLNEVTFSLIQAGTIDAPSWFALPLQPSLLRTVIAVVTLAVASGALSEVHAEAEEALVRIRNSAYVDAARARGEPTTPHVAWNLVLPLTTVATTRAAFLVGGLVILEKVLLLNGAGSILWRAALERDWPVALGIGLFAAAAVATIRLVSDVVRLAVDPRLRTGSAS